MLRLAIDSQPQGMTKLDFENQNQIDLYLAEIAQSNFFGKPERWVLAYQEDVSQALDEREIVNEETGEILTEYKLAAQYSTSVLDVTQEYIQKSMIADGKAARDACQAVLDYIAGANLYKELTIQQITQMQTTYANADAALRASRPTYAKQFISAITPDGTIVTATEKANCLSLLSAY